MEHKYGYIPFIFIFLSLTLTARAEAEPRYVNLEEELQFASMVLPVKILSYDSGALKFQTIGKTTVISAKYSDDPKWIPASFTLESWPPKDEKVVLTGNWPPVNAEVLIVTDKANIVSLFAYDYGQEYRFWSPIITGSVALFECKGLGRLISPVDLKDRPFSSWDGCLVEKTRIITTDRQIPLHQAIVNSDSQTVEMLLEQGVDIEHKDSYDRTPLQLAFDFDKLDIAKLLIKRGADIEVKDAFGKTLLHRVIRFSHLGRICYLEDSDTKMLEAIKLLIELKPSLINVKDNGGKTPWEAILMMMYSRAEDDSLKFIRPFVTQGADLETRNWGDGQNFTPFQWMILDGRLKTAKLLFENGANVNVRDEDGRSLLYIFVEQYHSRINNKTEVIELLLEYGVDPNIADNYGRIPLHRAAEKSNPDIARILLKYGAEPSLKDKEGLTAMDRAKLLGNNAVAELLASEIKK